MSLFKNRILAAAAAGALLPLAGLGLTAGAAYASSTGCAFSNGCATLHGTDANGNSVAMDAKYQKKTEILIGYADSAGDGATSFDGVLHYGRGTKSTTYQDTALQVSHLDNSCTGTPGTLTVGSSTVAGSGALTVSNPPSGVTITGSGTDSLGFAGLTGGGSIVVDENYGTDCAAAWTVALAGGSLKTVSGPDKAGTIGWQVYAPGGIQFTDASVPGGTYGYSGLPSLVKSSDSGTLTVATSTAPPQTDSSVTVSFTDSNGAEVTYTFELVVSALKSVTPGAGTAFYTFVYAPKGDWTSQCVTDINGSGALKLFPCTLGKDTGQDFTVDSTSGLLSGSQAHVKNLLAAAAGANACLVDPSTSAAATPQSDTADEVAPGGRQLYVNGSCAANVDLWSWGT